MATKEIIDIEALLHRAYAQHRVDRVTPQAMLGLRRQGPSASLVGAMQAVALGTIVDNSGAAARMIGQQTMMAATPDDMLIVHDHVLALEEWRIENPRSPEPRAWRLSEIAARGWHVEETAAGGWLVRHARRGADGAMRTPLVDPYLFVTVIEHARAGTRPDVDEALQAGRGRPNAAALAQRGDAMLARALYAVWHAALGSLAADLGAEGVLQRHHVTGPVAPATPWDAATQGAVLASTAKKAFPQDNSATRKSLRQHYNRRV